jgi:hypothetical protein
MPTPPSQLAQLAAALGARQAEEKAKQLELGADLIRFRGKQDEKQGKLMAQLIQKQEQEEAKAQQAESGQAETPTFTPPQNPTDPTQAVRAGAGGIIDPIGTAGAIDQEVSGGRGVQSQGGAPGEITTTQRREGSRGAFIPGQGPGGRPGFFNLPFELEQEKQRARAGFAVNMVQTFGSRVTPEMLTAFDALAEGRTDDAVQALTNKKSLDELESESLRKFRNAEVAAQQSLAQLRRTQAVNEALQGIQTTGQANVSIPLNELGGMVQSGAASRQANTGSPDPLDDNQLLLRSRELFDTDGNFRKELSGQLTFIQSEFLGRGQLFVVNAPSKFKTKLGIADTKSALVPAQNVIDSLNTVRRIEDKANKGQPISGAEVEAFNSAGAVLNASGLFEVNEVTEGGMTDDFDPGEENQRVLQAVVQIDDTLREIELTTGQRPQLTARGIDLPDSPQVEESKRAAEQFFRGIIEGR